MILVRGISLRKKSVVNKEGDVNWRKCDVVSLVCPAAQQLNMTDVLAQEQRCPKISVRGPIRGSENI